MVNKKRLLIFFLVGILIIMAFGVKIMIMKEGKDIASSVKEDPLTCAGLALIDVTFGGICLAVSKLTDKNKKAMKKGFLLLGMWNCFGGAILAIVAAVIFFGK